jgi:cytidine deaminase
MPLKERRRNYIQIIYILQKSYSSPSKKKVQWTRRGEENSFFCSLNVENLGYFLCAILENLQKLLLNENT